MDTSSEISSNSSKESSSSISSVYTDLNEENLQSYLCQFQYGFDWNPSDDSDFEDTSYEIDNQYEIEKLQEKKENLWQEKEITKKREANAERYYKENQKKTHSIFKKKGISFIRFNHLLIQFVFTPCAFSKKYICKHRKYRVSLIYEKKWWTLKRFRVPNKSEVLEIFNKTVVNDKTLMKVLDQIYESLKRNTKQQIKARQEKHKKYLLGQEVYFNSDDEKLLLSSDEIEKRQEKINKIWKRMLPPNNKQK